MRKISLLLAPLFLLTFLGGIVLAQETELPDPGLTPDSPFYFFDTLGEKIGMFFTFGTEKKAEKTMKYAEEKLAEAKAIAEKKKPKALEKAGQRYQEFLGLANAKIQEAKEKGRDVEELVTLITEKTLKHQEILVETFEKVPEETKTAIKKVIEASRKGAEKVAQAMASAKKEELLQKIWEIKGSIFPHQIGTYTLDSDPEEEFSCQRYEEQPDVESKLTGEICTDSRRAEYRDSSSNKVVFVIAIKFTKGRDLWKKHLKSLERPVLIGDQTIFRIEKHELGWWTDSFQFNRIFTQEGRITSLPNGTSYSYGTATGENPVTQYFLEKYPSYVKEKEVIPEEKAEKATLEGKIITVYLSKLMPNPEDLGKDWKKIVAPYGEELLSLRDLPIQELKITEDEIRKWGYEDGYTNRFKSNHNSIDFTIFRFSKISGAKNMFDVYQRAYQQYKYNLSSVEIGDKGIIITGKSQIIIFFREMNTLAIIHSHGKNPKEKIKSFAKIFEKQIKSFE